MYYKAVGGTTMSVTRKRCILFSASLLSGFLLLMLSACDLPFNNDLYAIATTHLTYTVTYDPNGADSGTPPFDYSRYASAERVFLLSNGSLGKSSYSFGGWNTNPDSSGNSYWSGDSYVMPTRYVTFFAIWLSAPSSNLASVPPNMRELIVPSGINVDTTFGSGSYPQMVKVTFIGNSSLTAGAFNSCPDLTDVYLSPFTTPVLLTTGSFPASIQRIHANSPSDLAQYFTSWGGGFIYSALLVTP